MPLSLATREVLHLGLEHRRIEATLAAARRALTRPQADPAERAAADPSAVPAALAGLEIVGRLPTRLDPTKAADAAQLVAAAVGPPDGGGAREWRSPSMTSPAAVPARSAAEDDDEGDGDGGALGAWARGWRG